MKIRFELFQFHTGSIKSWMNKAHSHLRACFNSILVRLKEEKAMPRQAYCKRFNSILVRLKELKAESEGEPVKEFQFHTGSIKRKTSALACSIQVLPFQFHTGSIKSHESENDTKHNAIQFQFHTGSIKRVMPSYLSFRFHTCFNSILVRLKGSQRLARWQLRQRFNSILVRLKVYPFERRDTWHINTFQFHTGSIKSENDENTRGFRID